MKTEAKQIIGHKDIDQGVIALSWIGYIDRILKDLKWIIHFL